MKPIGVYLTVLGILLTPCLAEQARVVTDLDAAFGSSPAITANLDNVTLMDAVATVAREAKLSYVVFGGSPIWNERISEHGTLQPAEFFSKMRKEYGIVVRRRDSQPNGYWEFVDGRSEQLLHAHSYELNGILGLSMPPINNRGTGEQEKAALEKKVAEVLRGSPEEAAREPNPTAFYSEMGGFLFVVATDEQHARLREYLAKVDRPAHRFAMQIKSEKGRTLFFASALCEGGLIGKSSQEPQNGDFYFGLVPTVEDVSGKLMVRVRGWLAVGGSRIAVDQLTGAPGVVTVPGPQGAYAVEIAMTD